MEKDNTLKVITHVLAYLSSWLGPLIILLVIKEEDVKQHARKALNWQISMTLYATVISTFFFITALSLFVAPYFFVLILLVVALFIVDLIFCLVATIKASKDELWTYPLAIPFLR